MQEIHEVTPERWPDLERLVGAQDTAWRLNARERLSQLLDAVASGEEILIVRRGRPAARLVPVEQATTPFPDCSSLRDELPPMRTSAGATIREMREHERF